MLEAHRLGEDLLQAAVRIAAQYARDGESLDTFLHDFAACRAVLGIGSPDSAALRSVSIAWADEYSGRYDHISCRHHGSRLHSVHHLQSHVRAVLSGEQPRAVRGYLGRSTAYALLVVELAAELVTPAHVVMLEEELVATAPPGAVIASLSSRRSVALLRRTPATSELAGRLDRSLSARMEATRNGRRPRIWIEGLPHDVDAASLLVAELAR